MTNNATLRAVLLAGALSLVGAGTAVAQTFGTNQGGNYFPFGCNGCAGSPYQQVYASGPFGASPVFINSITFYSDGLQTFSDNTFTYRLSTTSAAVNGLSSNQASNVGADDALFAITTPTGSWSGAFTTSGSPFTYDPTMGNLLLQIFISGMFNGSDTAAQADYSGTSGTSRNYGSGADNGGLVTTFNTSPAVTPTPEPTSIVLSATGLLGVIGFARRRRVA